MRLTDEQIARIRELRYLDGYSLKQTAAIAGCHYMTVRRYAPGRPGKVPVAPLREAFLASGMTAADIARKLGWWSSRGADSSRVKHTLGLIDDVSGGTRRRSRSRRTHVDAELVALIAEAIGIAAWEVLPDDEAVEAA